MSEMTHTSGCNRHALGASRHIQPGFDPHIECVRHPVGEMPWGMCAPMLA
ncbi:MAG TPA: hypothetical protein PLC34_10045 [Burkholderiaceae bacterium]|nr:hypothetical protein [Burkholderiaceae bacterium]